MIADYRVAVDRRLMGLALALGRRNLGLTWPNPSVGAVLVRDGRILSQAVTQTGGRPHAEPVAIAKAEEGGRGATLYVSLEPCSHHGRTPPCAEAIVAAGIARVVTALEDANPLVAGRGHAILRAAGVAVTTDVLAAEAARDHAGHHRLVREHRPQLTLKLARTADGFAARRGGGRVHITGEGANARTHMLRARSDAILVGVGTVLADDPRLDVRLPGLEARRPVRVVIDSTLRIDPSSRPVASAAAQPIWIVCTQAAGNAAEGRLRESGVEVIRVAQTGDGRVDLAAALRALGARGLTRVLCEAGPTLADALAAAGLVDDMVLITSGMPLGEPGIPAIGPALTRERAGMKAAGSERVGDDVIEISERIDTCSPGS